MPAPLSSTVTHHCWIVCPALVNTARGARCGRVTSCLALDVWLGVVMGTVVQAAGGVCVRVCHGLPAAVACVVANRPTSGTCGLTPTSAS